MASLVVGVAFSLRSFADFELINDHSYSPGTALTGPKDLVRAADGAIWMLEDTISERVAPRGVPGRPIDTVFRLTPEGTVDPSFGPWRFYGQLSYLSPTPDGGVLIGGDFPSVAVTGLAHFSGKVRTSTSGSPPRPSFFAQIPDRARHAVAQSDGKVVVLLETNCTRVVRLQVDGAADGSFTPINLGGCGRRLAIQTDDRILALGNSVLERFLPNGSPDTSFATTRFEGHDGFDPVGMSSVLLPEANGRVVVSGHFDTVNGLPRHRLVRLLADGTVDPGFIPPRLANWGPCEPDGCAAQIFNVQPAGQGQYWVMGAFERADDQPCRALMRLNGDGSLDPKVTGIKPFLPGTLGTPQPLLADLGTTRAMIPLVDGRILVGVHSSVVDVWGQPDVGMATGLAMVFGPDLPAIQLSDEESPGVEDSGKAAIEVRRWGPLEASQSFHLELTTNDLAEPAIPGSDFLPLPNTHRFEPGEWIKHVPIPLTRDGRPEPDKQLRVVLSAPNPAVRLGQSTNDVVLYDDDRVGAPDPSFLLRGNWPLYVSSVDVLPEGGGFLVGREGTESNLVALWTTADGQLIRRWSGTTATEQLRFAAPLANGKVLALLNHDSSSSTHPLLLLGADGTPDPSFRPSIALAAWSQIQRLVNLPDGAFLILGAAYVDTHLVGRIARINATGEIDPSFASPDFGTGLPMSAALDTEGRLLVAGTFASVNGNARPGLARLTTHGALDELYLPSAGLNATADPDVAVLAIQRDGKALIRVATVTFGGKTTSGIVRLLSSGEVDLNFIQGRGGEGVSAAAVLPDQRILIGGTFLNFHGLDRARLAMLLPTGAIDSTFKVDEFATPHFTSLAVDPGGWVWVGGWYSLRFPYVFDSVAKACVTRILGWQVPRMVGASTSPASQGQVTFTTKPGTSFLESSVDLRHWQTLRTNLSTDGVLTFEGFRDPAAPQQYLRLRSD
ncbi:MAG: hypothetical protein IT581_20010 [Verrucomicrobiales bacterium]|nr:hypothetical protein [Verrucomicrobiales bacterium]